MFRGGGGKEGDWKIMKPHYDETQDKDVWVSVGRLWRRGDWRLEGKLDSEKSIVAFHSKNKKDKIDKIRVEKNMGKITEEEYNAQYSQINRAPDLILYYDNIDRLEDNARKSEVMRQISNDAPEDAVVKADATDATDATEAVDDGAVDDAPLDCLSEVPF